MLHGVYALNAVTPSITLQGPRAKLREGVSQNQKKKIPTNVLLYQTDKNRWLLTNSVSFGVWTWTEKNGDILLGYRGLWRRALYKGFIVIIAKTKSDLVIEFYTMKSWWLWNSHCFYTKRTPYIHTILKE